MALAKHQRIALGVVCAIPLVILVIIKLQPKRPMAAVGEDCRNNVFCESGKCLRIITDATGPRNLPVDGPGGICTGPCTLDGDCPSTMRCGAIAEYSLFPGVGTAPPPTAPHCVPRV